MIYIKATARGEPDALPLARTFQYADKDDELILHHSVEMVKEKLLKNMKLNVNEALLLYAYFVTSQMRAKKHTGAIEKDAKAVLSAGQVMIGVPETLRTIAFDAVVDGRRDWVVLKEPIPSSGYIMAAE
ncbi:MAG: urease subunit gamma [Nitrososphaera sp.]|uniref:urease subunit gamma n=1 Tax=Nitrososphaera sp. TaxID=1971748 RepID=UPI001843A5A3|nr:urease subunit gamma [Nitrososphaera sp.]NWG37422.1 urease subunit gamma [Nitrososphaera sp.]